MTAQLRVGTRGSALAVECDTGRVQIEHIWAGGVATLGVLPPQAEDQPTERSIAVSAG